MAKLSRRGQVDAALNGWVAAGKPNICLLFAGAKTRAGYGHMIIDGNLVYTHRYALERFAGPCPDGFEACHAPAEVCGNRHCFSPAHLRWGTPKANMADRVADGTLFRPRGTANGEAKLTDSDVLEIRRRYAASGISQSQLAAEFGVSKGQISFIVRRKCWAHLNDDGTWVTTA